MKGKRQPLSQSEVEGVVEGDSVLLDQRIRRQNHLIRVVDGESQRQELLDRGLTLGPAQTKGVVPSVAAVMAEGTS